ncbi:FHL3 protein, partial [Scopus umbretta]|nr:FHL3 protein [Columbina picui]NXX55248.1 FHL3 protein [Scopus umbretta]
PQTLTKGGVTYRDEPWHKECFVCTGCKTPLAGQQFTSQDDNPYCIKCFGNLYAKKCSACTKPITGFGGGKYVSFEDRHWHHNCFNCARCNTSLVGKGFIPDNDEILCRDCSSDL